MIVEIARKVLYGLTHAIAGVLLCLSLLSEFFMWKFRMVQYFLLIHSLGSCSDTFPFLTIFVILILHTLNHTMFIYIATVNLLFIGLGSFTVTIFGFYYSILWIATYGFSLESFCSQVMSASAAFAAYRHETTTSQPLASAECPSTSGRKR